MCVRACVRVCVCLSEPERCGRPAPPEAAYSRRPVFDHYSRVDKLTTRSCKGVAPVRPAKRDENQFHPFQHSGKTCWTLTCTFKVLYWSNMRKIQFPLPYSVQHFDLYWSNMRKTPSGPRAARRLLKPCTRMYWSNIPHAFDWTGQIYGVYWSGLVKYSAGRAPEAERCARECECVSERA